MDAIEPPTDVPLAKRLVRAGFSVPEIYDSQHPRGGDPSPGRRLRVFACLVHGDTQAVRIKGLVPGPSVEGGELTFGEALTLVETAEGLAEMREKLSRLHLRVGGGRLYEEIPAEHQWAARDPDLAACLQDLGDEINEDIHEACAAFDNPDVHYPGVSDGIEPVGEDHVRLVIWALQRELNRERRNPMGKPMSTMLPAPVLSDLPWRVQRALAERRRLRYRQWGIGREQWREGFFSLWDVPRDDDYVPRRARRLGGGV